MSLFARTAPAVMRAAVAAGALSSTGCGPLSYLGTPRSSQEYRPRHVVSGWSGRFGSRVEGTVSGTLRAPLEKGDHTTSYFDVGMGAGYSVGATKDTKKEAAALLSSHVGIGAGRDYFTAIDLRGIAEIRLPTGAGDHRHQVAMGGQIRVGPWYPIPTPVFVHVIAPIPFFIQGIGLAVMQNVTTGEASGFVTLDGEIGTYTKGEARWVSPDRR
mgnify:CR=1 FL=1